MRTATFVQPILIMAAIFEKITAMPLPAALPIYYLQVAATTAVVATDYIYVFVLISSSG